VGILFVLNNPQDLQKINPLGFTRRGLLLPALTQETNLPARHLVIQGIYYPVNQSLDHHTPFGVVSVWLVLPGAGPTSCGVQLPDERQS
jgi:hypothetical protein